MTYEDPVSVLGMGAVSSAVGTMQSTSSNLLNAPDSRYVGTLGSTSIFRASNTPYLIAQLQTIC